MDFSYFVEGPLLSAVLALFFLGLGVRTALFVVSTLRNPQPQTSGKFGKACIFVRFLLPYHRSAFKKPIYTLTRYLFHICLFVVPIWLYEHILLWEESRFEMYWQPLPDMWADRLILIVLVLAACFLIRRIFVRHVRKNSSISDYALILIAALPFLSGYMLTHGTLAHISFFDANMFTIHVLGGETMLLTAVFLFSSIRLDRNKCVGCAACEISCPTGTLTSFDENSVRVFDYSHYRCICCGACVRTCPEGAAGLRHDIGIGNFFRIVSKRNIGTSELSVCNGCRESYLPVVQLDKLEKMLPDETVHLCPACKTAAVTERLHRLDPRRMQPIGAVKPNLHPPSRPA